MISLDLLRVFPYLVLWSHGAPPHEPGGADPAPTPWPAVKRWVHPTGNAFKERSMSISSSGQSIRAAARAGEPRNGHPAAAVELFPGESDRCPRAVPDLRQEPFDDREWQMHVAREARHQEEIEASFDRAEAYARV